MAGKGKAFENLIQQKCDLYYAQNIAYIQKVDPPTKVIGTGSNKRIIFMENPFLDFTGAIRSWHGASETRVDFEAKDWSRNRLPFCKSPGLTEKQWQAMKKWDSFESDVFLLWSKDGEVRKFKMYQLYNAEKAQANSIEWGVGRLVVDMNFLEVK